MHRRLEQVADIADELQHDSASASNVITDRANATSEAACFGQSAYNKIDLTKDNTCDRQPCELFGTSDPYLAYCLKMACANAQRNAWCKNGGNIACDDECGGDC